MSKNPGVTGGVFPYNMLGIMNPKKDKTPTVTIFRKWPNGSIIAIFPENPGTNNPYTCDMYEHVGQHGAGDPVGVIQRTKLASSGEYTGLKRELESIGYRVQVAQKYTQSMQDKRLAKLHKTQIGSNKNPYATGGVFPYNMLGIMNPVYKKPSSNFPDVGDAVVITTGPTKGDRGTVVGYSKFTRGWRAVIQCGRNMYCLAVPKEFNVVRKAGPRGILAAGRANPGASHHLQKLTDLGKERKNFKGPKGAYGEILNTREYLDLVKRTQEAYSSALASGVSGVEANKAYAKGMDGYKNMNPRPPKTWWDFMYTKIKKDYPKKKSESPTHYKKALSQIVGGIWWGYPQATRARLIKRYD